MISLHCYFLECFRGEEKQHLLLPYPSGCGCQARIRKRDGMDNNLKRIAMTKNAIILIVILALLIGIYIGSVDYLGKMIIINFG